MLVCTCINGCFFWFFWKFLHNLIKLVSLSVAKFVSCFLVKCKWVLRMHTCRNIKETAIQPTSNDTVPNLIITTAQSVRCGVLSQKTFVLVGVSFGYLNSSFLVNTVDVRHFNNTWVRPFGYNGVPIPLHQVRIPLFRISSRKKEGCWELINSFFSCWIFWITIYVIYCV